MPDAWCEFRRSFFFSDFLFLLLGMAHERTPFSPPLVEDHTHQTPVNFAG